MNKIKANYKLNLKYSYSYFFICLLCSLPVILLTLYTSLPLNRHPKPLPSVTITNNIENTSNFSVSYVGIFLLLMIIYLIIFCIASPKQILTYSIRMSSTRKDYFLGSIAFYAIISVIFSLTYTLLFLSENLLLNYLGIQQINNYTFIFKSITFTGMLRFTIYNFLVFLVIISFTTLLSYMAYKLGQYTWLFIGIFLLISIFEFIPFIISLLPAMKITDINIDMINIAAIIICFTLSYITIIGTTIKNI